MKLFGCLLMAFFATANAVSLTNETSTSATLYKPRKKFIVFGDSITELGNGGDGWVTRLENTYPRRVDVLNRGYSGYNTRWAKMMLPIITTEWFSPRAPDLVTIFFGANDIAGPNSISYTQHVPIEEYTENLQFIVKELKSKVKHVIIITPPPVDETARKQLFLREKQLEISESDIPRKDTIAYDYGRQCVKVGKEMNVPVLDLWTGFRDEPNWKKLLIDGLHLTAQGNIKVHTLLMKLIENDERLSELSNIEAIPLDAPSSDKVDYKDPEKSFLSMKKGYTS